MNGSDGACRAVEWAAGEAAIRRRPLHILYCVDSSIYGAPLFAPQEAVRSLPEAGEQVLADAARIARERRAGIEVTTELVADFAFTALRDRSRSAFEPARTRIWSSWTHTTTSGSETSV